MPSPIPCRHCLLSELPDEQALAALIQSRIALLPPEDRTENADYARRLAACRACNQLHRGTCVLCGCYVEIRAARRAQCCPHTDHKWD